MQHPDTIPDLAPDCRRVLREEFQRIQVAKQPARVEPRRTNLGETQGAYQARVAEAEEQRREAIVTATAEYRRVAALWGISL